MDFKKYGIVYLLIILVVGLFSFSRIFPSFKFDQILNNSSVSRPSSSPQQLGVTVTINDGTTIKSYKNIKAGSAYEGLVTAAKENNLTLKTKNYSFGVFIEQIGVNVNSNDKAWIYYVNSKAGDVASDKQVVKDGDTIEWKYEKPSF